MSTIDRLSRWYASQCDGEWEHGYGITIENCDNPGWLVKIDLRGTTLEGVEFSSVANNVDAEDFQLGNRWIVCHVKDAAWNGAGDETKLEQILITFLDWAEPHSR